MRNNAVAAKQPKGSFRDLLDWTTSHKRVFHSADARLPAFCVGGQENLVIGKLTPHETWVREQVKAKGDITLGEMTTRLVTGRGVSVDLGQSD